MSVVLAEVWRGEVLECVHRGDAVVVDAGGEVVAAWGDPDKLVLPRSSAKMLQALPLVESGAADAAGLDARRLALACASHEGAAMHTGAVAAWLADIGLGERDLRCGAHMPKDADAYKSLLCSDTPPCQLHNNCSGKHAGFLTLGRHLRAGPEYVEVDHPVQKAVREAFEDVTGMPSPTHAIDGCSAPNFATTLRGLGRAMARFAAATEDAAATRDRAAFRLVQAMMAHPELVAGEGRACTELMRAARGRAAVKTGAEGVFVAILPEAGLGIALKVEDGATRASECAIAALLVRYGALEAGDPAVKRRMNPTLRNWRGLTTGALRPGPELR
ncbi:MAG: asparaginase [Alphaproteobacteria bacterium]|nr:MAG: asparaginase [Alphaproteobacteria bacterium]